MSRRTGVFFVSGEFAFTDRFPSWKRGGSPELRAARSPDFAASSAEVVFVATPDIDAARTYYSTSRRRSADSAVPQMI